MEKEYGEKNKWRRGGMEIKSEMLGSFLPWMSDRASD